MESRDKTAKVIDMMLKLTVSSAAFGTARVLPNALMLAFVGKFWYILKRNSHIL